MSYYDQNGEEVDGVMSPEEVQALLAENEAESQRLIEEAHVAAEEQANEVGRLLAEKEAELEKLHNKDMNFGRLRGKTEADGSKIAALEKQIDEMKGGIISQIDKINQVMSEKEVSEAILVATGGDRELAEKVKTFYKTFNGAPKDAKEMQQRIDNSLTLAGGGRTTIVGANVYSAAGGTFQSDNVGGQSKWTDTQKELGRNLGITDADIAKYQNKMPRYPGDFSSNREWLGKG